jgi:hypothetical protein
MYTHYGRHIHGGSSAAYKIEIARNDIRRFVAGSERFLLPLPTRIYRQKVAQIDRKLWFLARAFPKPSEAMNAIVYSKARVKGWFMLLFLAQVAPLAFVILFVSTRIYRSWRTVSQDDIYSGMKIDRIADSNDIRLERADYRHMSLYHFLKRSGHASPTARALLGILAAHEEWPASISGHMPGYSGLIDHNEAVVRAAIKLSGEASGVSAACAVVAALGHDSGKILVYQRQGGVWISKGLYHDSRSAFILSSLPEFHRQFRAVEREAILLAVRHHHSPLDLPVNAPPLAKALLKIIQKADNIAVRDEGSEEEMVEDIASQLESAFQRLLPELNIDRWRGGNADGWTSGGTVFILEHALREGVYRYLGDDVRRRFPASRQDGQLHPLWQALKRHLTDKGLLVDEVDGVASNNGFFDLKVNGTVFRSVVALDATKLDIPEEWGLGQQADIIILDSNYVYSEE